MIANIWPIPPHFQADRVGEVWRVPYADRAIQAQRWAQQQEIQPAATDAVTIALLLIDVQNTFCIPEFELFVGGRSGLGAIADNRRLCEFIYGNLGYLSAIVPTMDTHTAMQIFHPIFWINIQGNHPTPTTMITLEDVRSGVWQVNPAVASSVMGGNLAALQQHGLHYTAQLTQEGKYPLTIWPYHSMVGGIGHALVSAVEEAIFFHSLARMTQAQFELKGDHPLTENYSVLRPEVMTGADDRPVAPKNQRLIDRLLNFDAVLIAGQAKSHCVAWTIADLLQEIQARDPKLADHIYLLEDCMSPVVVPGVVDFTEAADQAFAQFAAAGMHVVRSTELDLTQVRKVLSQTSS